MLEKFFEKVLDDEEFGIQKNKEPEKWKEPIKVNWLEVVIGLGLFVLALAARLWFLYNHDPQSPGYGWYGDVYHHWQIAYLSKTIGFQQSFLRLWDLKGLEFFWGLLHPLMLAILFWLTGSVDIIIPRLLSIFCASVTIVFVYLIIKRWFSRWAAIIVALWFTFFSIAWFSDTLGMQEQLGLVFLFAGILAWPRFGAASGFFWALASMVRSEYWIFAFVLTILCLFDRRKKYSGQKVTAFVFYTFPIALYMVYMNRYTNNPIFPIYWNYLASYAGEWFTNTSDPLTPMQITGQWVGRFYLLVAVVGGFMTVRKRPKEYLFLALGFLNLGFVGMVFGFGAYIHGFFERFWFDRLFAFPYLFLGSLLILLLMGWLPKKWPQIKVISSVFGVLLGLSMIGASQLLWGRIMHFFRFAQLSFPGEIKTARFIAQNDPGGKILFPENRPALTYALVNYEGVEGSRFVSQMYDPFYYASGVTEPLEMKKELFNWLEKEEISLIVFAGRDNYVELLQDNPDKFKLLDQLDGLRLYEFLR